MSSASNVSGYRFRSNGYFFALMGVVFGVAAPAQAQMFSVKPQRQSIELPGVVIQAGLERMDVSRSLPGAQFTFSGDLLRLGVEAGGLVASYSTGRGLGATDIDYSSFEVALTSGVQLFRRDVVQLALPFTFYSVNTTMTSPASQITNSDFRQNALGARTGLQTQVRLGSRMRIVAFGTGGYAFSANGFNAEGGALTQWDAGARLHVDGIYRSAGLTVGILAHQRVYEVDNKANNYDMNSISILFGVTF